MKLDSRVARGLEAQLARRSELLAGGAEPIGWKIGFNVPQWQERLGIDAPVVGYLTDATLVQPGEGHALAGAAGTVLVEPELAIHMGADLSAGAEREDAARAIAGYGAALEVVDIRPPVDDLELVLADNVFHRALLLADPSPIRELEDVHARVRLNGKEHGTAAAAAASGEPADVALHVALLLESAGERLHAGDRVIAGTLTPGIAVRPGDRVELDLGALGRAALAFA